MRNLWMCMCIAGAVLGGCATPSDGEVHGGLPAADVGTFDPLDVTSDVDANTATGQDVAADAGVASADDLDATRLYGSSFSEVTDYDAIGAEFEPSSEWPASTYFTLHHVLTTNLGTCVDETYFGGPRRLERCWCDLSVDDNIDGGPNDPYNPFCSARYSGYVEDFTTHVAFRFGLNESWYSGPGVYYTAHDSCFDTPTDGEYAAGGLPSGATFVHNEMMVVPDIYANSATETCGAAAENAACEQRKHSWKCTLNVTSASATWFEAQYACEDLVTIPAAPDGLTSRRETFEGSFGFVPSACKKTP